MPGKNKTQELLTRASNPSEFGVRLLTQLAEAIDPQKVVEAVKGMIEATTHVRISSEDFIEVPDNRAREAGVKLYFAYTVGLPIQRQLIQTQEIPSEDDAKTRLLDSPAARKALAMEAMSQMTPEERAEMVNKLG